jgi:hypothetical protein
LDPIAARDAARAAKRLALANAMTFREAAEAFIREREKTYKSAKHAAQWPATFATYVYPVFGNPSVAAVDTDHVLKVLGPTWFEKTETASRVRQRMEKVLIWARVEGKRTGENPARWRGRLEHRLTARGKVAALRV